MGKESKHCCEEEKLIHRLEALADLELLKETSDGIVGTFSPFVLISESQVDVVPSISWWGIFVLQTNCRRVESRQGDESRGELTPSTSSGIRKFKLNLSEKGKAEV